MIGVTDSSTRQVAVAGAALGEATEAWVNSTHRGIAKPLLPRPPRRGCQRVAAPRNSAANGTLL